MKKFLPLHIFYFAAYTAIAQSGAVAKINRTAVFIQQLKTAESKNQSAYVNPLPHENMESQAKESNASTAISWSLLCGSMNVYGMLSNQSRPLQFNPSLNAVSFIHRKSDSYNPYPLANSNSGNIVAEISSDWGQHWDSTCIWADATNGGRYPQGAIYNPPGNTNIANAYVVGCGPVVANNAFTGDWYASKQIGQASTAVYNPTPSTVSGAQQFLSFSLTAYPAHQAPHGWSMQGFTSTEDGVVRSLALIDDDNTDANTMRGAMLVIGHFNAGVFVWTTDSLVPSVVAQSSGNRQFSTKVQMAWNQSGTVGYVVIIGALNAAVGSNRGLQPIIYKTTTSGTSWTLLNGIDFNAPSNASVIKPLAGVETDATLKIPYVDDFDLVVDKNNYLHMGLILASTASDQSDSLQYISQFTTSINPNDEYKWKHIPGNRPYLYDFIGDGSQAWKYVLIDSLSSEGPGSVAGSSGFIDNPWDISSGDKIAIDSRLQMGRSSGGEYITFSWAETDSAFISQSKKWNIQPNVKVRSIVVNNTLGNPTPNIIIMNDKYNISKPLASQGQINTKIAGRSTLHFMSPVFTASLSSGAGFCNGPVNGTLDYQIPFTVTNSNPYSQLTNNSTWYTTAKLTFSFCIRLGGLNEKNRNNIDALLLPNPANETVQLKFASREFTTANLTLLNSLGVEVYSESKAVNAGENTIEMQIQNLPKGVYFVHVTMGDFVFTKKLIVE